MNAELPLSDRSLQAPVATDAAAASDAYATSEPPVVSEAPVLSEVQANVAHLETAHASPRA